MAQSAPDYTDDVTDDDIDIRTRTYVEVTVGTTVLRLSSAKARALSKALTEEADLIDGVTPLRDSSVGRHGRAA